ncbi:MAG TPA: MBL fold metallo-hydrolase [Oceanithermus profundus]|uniref:MBL fold metallo-hydrolase n=1 Tax=Oceanithermus profundus TaxID=187137 RepID=A0A7C4ZHF5_9DEIN|nr:MBL fold metallo-hydrolase [Oceanithermus profundus]
MRAIVLGSAGSQPIPMAGCGCRLCTLARREGGRAVRTGPSLYLPEADLLIDTPEEANLQLTGHDLAPRRVAWTHAHPDHAAGMRVVQFLARSAGRPVEGWIPRPLYPVLAARYPLDYLVDAGYLELRLVPPDRPFELEGVRVTPLAHDHDEPVFAFLFETDAARNLYAPDHVRSLPVPEGPFGWVVVQMPIPPLEALPFELPPEHEAWKNFYTFDQAVTLWRGRTRRLVFTHIYERAGMTPDELDAVAARAGDWVAFAYDGMELAADAKPHADEAARLDAFRREQARIEAAYADDPKRMRAELRRLWDRYKSSG